MHRAVRRSFVTCSVAVTALCSGIPASAQERPEGTETGARVTAEERPFVFVTDPTGPSAGRSSVGYGFGLGSGVAAARPLPASIATAGPTHMVSLGYGLTSTIAPFLTGEAGAAGASASGGVRVQLLDPSGPVRLALLGAALREASGGFGGFLRVASSVDLGALRVAANVHAEKVFARGRDRVDVIALAGATYRVLPGLRLGAEYVGQDLEDAIEREEAEGGAKHYAGPTAAIELDRGRAQLAFGPAFGLNATADRFLGRLSLTVAF